MNAKCKVKNLLKFTSTLHTVFLVYTCSFSAEPLVLESQRIFERPRFNSIMLVITTIAMFDVHSNNVEPIVQGTKFKV